PEADGGALAENILRLLADDALWERLSGNGVRAMREKFDLRKQTARLEEIYADVVCGRMR
ncbi:MAG TPA: hypothetical protein VFC39_15315, partial [Acidobacteriaceae bacterium]|nr:hypothetical protein [Acidobacteriaceae bacterium]